MFRKIKNFFSKIKRLFDYSKVIWGTVDWDYSSIFTLLQYSIQRTRISMKAGYCKHDKSKLRKMRVCELLIERILNDDYHKSIRDIEMVFGEQKNGIGKITFKYKNGKEKFDRDSKIAQDLKEHDYDLLFKIVRKHIRTWWD